MTWRAVRLWAEACIGPAGGTRRGTRDHKRLLMLANEAPDSLRVAESTKERQARVKFNALVVDESFWDSHMKLYDDESISCD